MSSYHIIKKISITSIAAIILTVGSLKLIHYLDRYPSTEDAYVQANTINIAAQVTGPVQDIFVSDHAQVKQGQLLFTIDPAPYQIAVNKVYASLAARRAALTLAQQNADRMLKLVKIGQQPKANGDQAISQLDSARAQLDADEAQLASAKLDLAHTRVTAPRAGILTQFTLQPGNNVIANATLFMLVEQNEFWVDANFKETQLARIKTGQPVKIILDMYPKQKFEGTVDAISTASGAVFALMPPENASGNWVKVTQRFPVKVIIQNPDPHYPLRAGATASVTIDTKEQA